MVPSVVPVCMRQATTPALYRQPALYTPHTAALATPIRSTRFSQAQGLAGSWNCSTGAIDRRTPLCTFAVVEAVHVTLVQALPVSQMFCSPPSEFLPNILGNQTPARTASKSGKGERGASKDAVFSNLIGSENEAGETNGGEAPPRCNPRDW